jgi:hypothetical protein
MNIYLFIYIVDLVCNIDKRPYHARIKTAIFASLNSAACVGFSKMEPG